MNKTDYTRGIKFAKAIETERKHGCNDLTKLLAISFANAVWFNYATLSELSFVFNFDHNAVARQKGKYSPASKHLTLLDFLTNWERSNSGPPKLKCHLKNQKDMADRGKTFTWWLYACQFEAKASCIEYYSLENCSTKIIYIQPSNYHTCDSYIAIYTLYRVYYTNVTFNWKRKRDFAFHKSPNNEVCSLSKSYTFQISCWKSSRNFITIERSVSKSEPRISTSYAVSESLPARASNNLACHYLHSCGCLWLTLARMREREREGRVGT